MSGETGIVTKNDFITSIYTVLKDISENDTFIFYFSGHGGKNCLVLSGGLIELQDLLNTIEQIQTKNKIAIIDSCHSGDFSLENIPTIDIDETVEHFAGRGFAVLASCGANQSSGFDEANEISLYTSFVCDALTARFLVRKGKKSLEAINEAIFHFAEVSNRKGKRNFQQPIFRSSIGGTIFFDRARSAKFTLDSFSCLCYFLSVEAEFQYSFNQFSLKNKKATWRYPQCF